MRELREPIPHEAKSRPDVEQEPTHEEQADHAAAQKQYFELLSRGEIDDFFKLREELGWDADDETIARGYEALVELGGANHIDVKEMEDLLEATNVKPSQAIITRAFEKAAGLGSPFVDLLINFAKHARRKPKMDPKIAHEWYRKLWNQECLLEVDRLEHFTGIRAEADDVQATYNELAKKGESEAIEKLMKNQQLAPEFEDLAVQGGYTLLTKNIAEGSSTGFRLAHLLARLQRLTRVRPTVDPELAEHAYERLLSHGEVEEFISVKKTLGATAPRELVKKGYVAAIGRGKQGVADADRLHAEYGLEITVEDKRNGLKKHLVGWYVDAKEARAMAKKLGVEMDDTFWQEVFDDIASSGRNYDRIVRRKHEFRVSPKPDQVARWVAERVSKNNIADLSQLIAHADIGRAVDAGQVRAWYESLAKVNDYRSLKSLYGATGIKPEPAMLEELFRVNIKNQWVYADFDRAWGTELHIPFLQNSADEFAREGDMAKLTWMASVARVRPGREAVLAGYEKLLRERSITALEHLHHITNEPITVSSEAMTELYDELLVQKSDFETALKLKKLTGVKPDLPPGFVSLHADQALGDVKRIKVGTVIDLVELAEQVPELPDQLIQNGYSELITDGASTGIRKFEAAVGKPLDEKTKMEGIEALVVHGYSYKKLGEVLEATGPIGKDDVVDLIKKLFVVQTVRDHIDRLSVVIQATGVRPDHDLVQSMYEFMVQTGQGNFDFAEIRRVTGVRPDRVRVRAWYQALFEKKAVHGMEKLHLLTGEPIVIDAEIVRAQYDKILRESVHGPRPAIIDALTLHELTAVPYEMSSEIQAIVLPLILANGDVALLDKAAPLLGNGWDAGVVQKGYRALVTRGKVSKLPAFMERLGPIEANAVDDLMGELLVESGFHDRLGKLEAFMKVTGRTPPSEMVQSAYRKLALGGSAKEFKRIAEITMVPIAREVALGLYPALLANGNVRVLHDVYEASAAVVPIGEDEAQRLYANYVTRGDIAPLSLLYQTLRRPVMLDDQTIQHGYTQVFRGRNTPDMKGALQLYDLTGVSPRIDEYLARRCFAALVVLGEPDDIKKFETVSGYAIMDAAIQDGYMDLIVQGSLGRLKDILVALGKPMDEATAQGAYGQLISGNWQSKERIRDAQKEFGIAASAETVQRAYGDALLNGRMENFKFNRDVFPEILPDPEMVQQAYRQLFERGEAAQIKSVREATGLKPEIDPQAIEKVYHEFVRGGAAPQLKAMIEALEVPLGELPAGAAQQGYTSIFKGGHQIPTRIIALYDVTKEKPNMAQRQFEECLRTLTLSGEFGSIPRLVEVADLEVTSAMKQELYKIFFEQGHALEKFDELAAVLGELPNADMAQLGYIEIIGQNMQMWDQHVKKLMGATNIPPSNEAVQQAYGRLARAGVVAPFEEVRAVTGFSFEQETILSAYQSMSQFFNSETPDRIAKVIQATKVPMPRATVNECYRMIVRGASLRLIKQMQKITGVNPEYTDAFMEAAQERFGRARSPYEYVTIYQTIERILPLGTPLSEHRAAWGPMLMRLAKIQAPASNEQYDPWHTDLESLLRSAHQTILDRDSVTDGEVLYDFVDNYGMFNLPTLLRWHKALRSVKKVSELPNEVRQEIAAGLGIKIEKMKEGNPGLIVEQIKQMVIRMKMELLEDKIPKELEEGRPIALELFQTIRGSTSWGGRVNMRDLVTMWRETLQKNPELGKLKDGYEAKTIEVHTTSIQRDDDEFDKEKETAKIVQNTEVISFLEQFDAAYAAASAEEDVGDWWKHMRAGMVELIKAEYGKVQDRYANTQDSRARAGMEKKIKESSDAAESLQALEFPRVPEDPRAADQAFVGFMDELAKRVPKSAWRDEVLRGMSARHMLGSMPEGMRTITNEQVGRRPPPWTREHVEGYAQVLSQYVAEHYLHPDQSEHDHVMHAPFGKELLRDLQNVWGVKGDLRKKHPLVRSTDLLRVLDARGRGVSEETLAVEMVPVRGILRIFSGDIGDSCVANRNEDFARGQFDRITPYVFVTGRGTREMRFRGSVQMIETKTPSGEGVLVVRANNPQENLMSQVDRADFLQKEIGQAIALADRRGLDYVVVPLSPARTTSSNRNEVADYYRHTFGKSDPLQLVNEPETNFNGTHYDIWNAGGSNKCVVVWQRARERASPRAT